MKAKDIAEVLGVSTSTISLVINNKPGVSDARRQEIIQKIRDMGYDHLLRDAFPMRENIGFVVYKRQGDIVDESPFFSYILEGISEKIEAYQYNLTVLYMSYNMSPEEQHALLTNSKCVGLIVFAVEMRYEDMQVFKESKLPFVMLDNSFHINDVDTVAINNAHGIYKALTYLYERNHRRIGYIASKVVINSFIDRLSAYRRSLKMLGLTYTQSDIVQVGYSDAEARADMFAYAKGCSDIPTAFVGDNDLVVCGAMKGLQDAGLRVPEDVSLIGFDDRPICTAVRPMLTTMMVPKTAFGQNCVDVLIGRMKQSRGYALKMEIGTILVERESVQSITQP